MIPKGLFTQIGMLIVSVAIVFTYIRPELEKVGMIQDDIAVYHEQLEDVKRVNSQLSNLLSALDSVSNDDRRRLITYMPDEVDMVAVRRDLLIMSEQAGVLYLSTSMDTKAGGDYDGVSIPYSFTLSVEGTYNQIKQLIYLIERNHYPLEIEQLEIVALDGPFLSADFSLTTYSFNDKVGANNQVILN